MTKERAEKKVLNYMRKHYPLLRKGLIMYFTEIIILTFEGFKYEDDFVTDTERLNYSVEINLCDEYHTIINDYNDNISDTEKQKYNQKYFDYMNKFNLVKKGKTK